MIKLKDLIKENNCECGGDCCSTKESITESKNLDREFGEPLPTLSSVMKKHQENKPVVTEQMEKKVADAMTRYLIDGLIPISTKTWRSESRNRKLCSFSYTRCDTSKSIFGKTTKIIETDIRAITKRVILDELNFFVIIKFIQVDSCLI